MELHIDNYYSVRKFDNWDITDHELLIFFVAFVHVGFDIYASKKITLLFYDEDLWTKAEIY